MRSSSSYRGAKKKAAREARVPFAKFNEHYAKSRVFAANQLAAKAINASPEAARKALAIWAANGGRATAASPAASQDDLDRMNAASLPEPTVEQTKEAVKKVTVADVDKAMEAALSRWQAERKDGPMPLSRLFAERARQMGWVENVEFVEEN